MLCVNKHCLYCSGVWFMFELLRACGHVLVLRAVCHS
jgi:hypothetical protein